MKVPGLAQKQKGARSSFENFVLQVRFTDNRGLAAAGWHWPLYSTEVTNDFSLTALRWGAFLHGFASTHWSVGHLSLTSAF